MNDEMTNDQPKAEPFMSLGFTDAVRGVLLLFVIIFHESNFLDIGVLPREGSYAVFMFFILSGYGLERSLSKRNYLTNFAQKKIIVLLLRYWYIDLIIIMLMAAMYSDYSDMFDRLMSTFTTTPHWYILQLLTFYLAFYIISISVEDGRRRMIVMTVAIIAIMNIQYYQFDSSALYRRSGFGFILGMVLAHHLDGFVGMERRRKIWICLACGIVLLFNELLDGDFTTYISPMLFSALILVMSSIDGRHMP